MARSVQQVAAILDEMIERDGLLLQLEAARLDPRQIEDLVDQRQQMAAAGVDVVRIFLVGGDEMGAEQLALHDFRKPEDGV